MIQAAALPRPLRVLIVEDDPVFAQAIVDTVLSIGGIASCATTLAEAVRAATLNAFDIITLDRILGGASADGLSMIECLHTMEIMPAILVISSLSGARHSVEGLTMGADDYLSKPFEPAELAARLLALARRIGTGGRSATITQVGKLEIRKLTRTVHWHGLPIDLSDQSFNILVLLADDAGHCIDRSLLWRHVWRDFPNLPPQDNVIEAAIKRLRQAMKAVLGFNPIITERGQGYRLHV
jgi:two-component system, OmpR family, response regulator